MQQSSRRPCPGSRVSIQENFAEFAIDAQCAAKAVEALPRAFAILSAHSERALAPANANRGWAKSAAKRVLDLLIALPALLALSPLLCVLAVLIRLESEGPALFRQKRLGLNGEAFDILKLRTMTVRENGASIVQAAPGDARLTRAGRWLRTLSLDELPQLFNVVKGEMSLVGPRPHAVAHDRYYGGLIASYARRQSVKPGLTGLAQVDGLRGPTPTLGAMERRVERDLAYVDRASFALDAAILLRTPLELLRRRNAV
jgi:putative colanic acid biosysnthesis UDP-glucose lipid carrier transferase